MLPISYDALRRRAVTNDELVQIGSHGPLFKLREPHTLESLRADAAGAEASPRRLCRLLGHRRREVGEPYLGEDEDDSLKGAFALLRASDVSALTRCERCGAVSIKGRF